MTTQPSHQQLPQKHKPSTTYGTNGSFLENRAQWRAQHRTIGKWTVTALICAAALGIYGVSQLGGGSSFVQPSQLPTTNVNADADVATPLTPMEAMERADSISATGWGLHIPSRDEPSYADGVCNRPKNTDLPFCDSSLDINDRVADLLDRIPVNEAINLLVFNASSAPSADLPAYGWWSEGLHGVAASPAVQFRDPTPFATSFPQIISLAASFNRSLFYRVADVTSTEARAFYNLKNGGLTYWTPNINIYRDPRWGRGQETPGEDPYLNGEYAVVFVRGLQGESIQGNAQDIKDGKTPSKFLKVSGCCKHFSAYSQEIPRHSNDAIVTKQDQEDTYFPAFEDCVTRGNVSSIMCSYNAVNGVPACADKALLTDLVRKEWKFDGYITSDCEAVMDIIYHHHYTQSPEQTCATVLSAGMDLNCGVFLTHHLQSALDKEIVTKDMIYTALGNLFRVQMRLGMFEKGGQPFASYGQELVNIPEHHALALESAHQSIVLLKNDDNTLPLSQNAFDKTGSLALIGPHLNASAVLLGNYNGTPSHIVTPLEGISQYVPNVSRAVGCKIFDEERPNLEEAETIAKSADRVVVFIGLDQSQEREEYDRDHIRLPGYQNELLQRVVDVVSQPIVLVVISGGSVDISAYKDHPKVGAILFGGYLGQAGGQALADVLFGTYNPSGRLTQTFYTTDFADTVSIYDMHMRPNEMTGNPGRTYRFFTGTPVYEFGHGFSYTAFDLSWTQSLPKELKAKSISKRLAKEQEKLAEGCFVEFSVSVRNSGAVDGEHIVLVYAEPPNAGVDGRPLKTLVGFERTVLLAPDQTSELHFCLPAKTFALANVDGKWVVEKGQWTIHVDDLRHDVEV